MASSASASCAAAGPRPDPASRGWPSPGLDAGRRDAVDIWRRYLGAQIDLGGSEVYRSSGPASAGRGRGRESAPPAAAAPAAPGTERWRVGAPPIPGPGLEVVTPAPHLLEVRPDYASLEAVAHDVAGCRRCPLCEGRTHTVPGEGHPAARLMCVGEGPGETEDRTGRPFVGRAGELLTEILAAIGLPRETVFIANVVKCRPPQNRKPAAEEMARCLPYLQAQIRLVRPRVLLALGATAAEGLLGVRRSLGELRGKVHRWDGIPLVVTYHPAALLRNPNWKKPTWDDVRIARQLLDA
jgi:uracil-DNA glycosylase family 4